MEVPSAGAKKGQFLVRNAGLPCCVAGQLLLCGHEKGCSRPFGGVPQQDWGELDHVVSFMPGATPPKVIKYADDGVVAALALAPKTM